MSQKDRFIQDLDVIKAYDLTPELAYVIGRIQNSNEIYVEDLGLLLNLLKGIITELRKRDFPIEIQHKVMYDVYMMNIGKAISRIKNAKRGLPSIEIDQTAHLVSRNKTKFEDFKSTADTFNRDQTAEVRDVYSNFPTELAEITSSQAEFRKDQPEDLQTLLAQGPSIPNLQHRLSNKPATPLDLKKSVDSSILPMKGHSGLSLLDRPYEPKSSTGHSNLPAPLIRLDPPNLFPIPQVLGGCQIARSIKVPIQTRCKLCELDLSTENVYETKACNHKFHISCIRGHASSLNSTNLICPYPNCDQSLSSELIFIKSLAQESTSPYNQSSIPILHTPAQFRLPQQSPYPMPSDPLVNAPNFQNPTILTSSIYPSSTVPQFQPTFNISLLKCNSCQRPCQYNNQLSYNCTYCKVSYCMQCKNSYLSGHQCPPSPSSDSKYNFRTIENRLLCNACSQDVMICRCSSDKLRRMK